VLLCDPSRESTTIANVAAVATNGSTVKMKPNPRIVGSTKAQAAPASSPPPKRPRRRSRHAARLAKSHHSPTITTQIIGPKMTTIIVV
jgi:hypothetical protein